MKPRSAWKKIIFSTAVFVVVFGALELALKLYGVRPLVESQDPSLGFSGLVALYAPDGDRFRTRDHVVRRTFNDQSFARAKPDDGLRLFVLGGSSAYGYPWNAEVSFGGILGDVLQAGHPERTVEMVNAAGISYAMHRLNIVADELHRYQPDVFVVYSGHNEFVEPGFFDHLRERGAGRNRLELALAHSRTFTSLYRLRHDEAGESRGAGHVEVTVRRDESVTYSDVEKQEIVAGFSERLTRLVRRAQERDVRVLLATVPCNLRQWRPERSTLDATLSEERRDRWTARFTAGKRAVEAQDWHAALEALEGALAISPIHAESRFLLARAHEGLERWEQAAEHYRAAVDLDASPIRRLGAINQVIRDVAAAEGALLVDIDRVFREHSPHGLTGFELIEDYVHPSEAGHRLIAREMWVALERAGWLGSASEPSAELFDRVVSRRAVARSETNPVWFVNQAVILEEQQRPAEAREKYRQALVLEPDHQGALWNLALLLDREGTPAEATPLVERLLELDPQHTTARIKLADLLSRTGRTDEAATISGSLAADAGSAREQNNLGMVYRRQGDLARASEHLARAVELDPEYALAHNNLGSVHFEQGRFDEARRCFDRALAIEPDLARAHYNLGYLSIREGDMVAARKRLQRAVELDPDYARAHFNLGILLMRAGDLEGARYCFERVVTLDATHAESHNNLGQVLAMSGDLRGARDCFRRALEQRADYPQARDNLQRAETMLAGR